MLHIFQDMLSVIDFILYKTVKVNYNVVTRRIIMKKGILNALITALLFMTLEPVSKLIANDVTPYAITLWRFAIGSLILIPFAVIKIKKEKLKICKRDLLVMFLLGILFICISMISLQLGVKLAESPSLIAIIFSSNSIFTLLFAILIVKEKFTKNKAIALCLCVAGLLFCADFSQSTGWISVLLALFAALSFSLYTTLSQKFMTSLGSAVQTCGVFLFGSVSLLVVLLVAGVDIVPEFHGNTLPILCYLGFFVTGIGYWNYFRGIEKGGAIMGSLAFFIKPILTPLSTFFINGITPDWKIFAALILIAAGSTFAIYEKQFKKKS